MSKTLGESRVRVNFNPSKDSLVDIIKQKTAELIDLFETMRQGADGGTLVLPGEKARLIALAQTEAESAGTWAVKAATFGL